MVPTEVRDFLKVLYRVFLIPYMERGECTHRTEDRLYPTFREWKGHGLKGPEGEPVMVLRCACGAVWADYFALRKTPHGPRLKRIPIRVEVEDGADISIREREGGGGAYGPGIRILSQEGVPSSPRVVPGEGGRSADECS